jgi:oxygen-dependent protoporphyrinogen oxidase
MSRAQIAIIGAGISGLCLAWYLQKKSAGRADILVFEKEARVGGWLESSMQGSFLFERGPRTLRSKSDLFLQLVKDLEIEEEVLTSSPEASIRYLASKEGSLEMMPRNMKDLIFSPLGRTILKGVGRSLFFPKKVKSDTSVEEYFSKRFGKNFTEQCIDPLTAGIYAALPWNLSMQSAFPDFGSFFQKKRASLLYSFRKGMAFLPKTVAERLTAKISLSCPVTAVFRHKSKIEIHTQGAGVYEVDRLFCAISAETLASLFPELAPLCLQIPSSKVVSVSFGFLQKAHLLPKGFGFLCSSSVESSLLGVIFDSNIFPRGNNHTTLSVMMGGERDSSLFELSDSEVIEKAERFFRKYLRIGDLYDEVLVSRASIPKYQVGHKELVKKLEHSLDGVHLVGSGFYGVSVADCIESAYKAANQYHLLT